jgi:hypothetical protein
MFSARPWMFWERTAPTANTIIRKTLARYKMILLWMGGKTALPDGSGPVFLQLQDIIGDQIMQESQ